MIWKNESALYFDCDKHGVVPALQYTLKGENRIRVVCSVCYKPSDDLPGEATDERR